MNDIFSFIPDNKNTNFFVNRKNNLTEARTSMDNAIGYILNQKDLFLREKHINNVDINEINKCFIKITKNNNIILNEIKDFYADDHYYNSSFCSPKIKTINGVITFTQEEFYSFNDDHRNNLVLASKTINNNGRIHNVTHRKPLKYYPAIMRYTFHKELFEKNIQIFNAVQNKKLNIKRGFTIYLDNTKVTVLDDDTISWFFSKNAEDRRVIINKDKYFFEDYHIVYYYLIGTEIGDYLLNEVFEKVSTELINNII